MNSKTALNWINNQWVDNGKYKESFNPATGEVFGMSADGGKQEAVDAISAAKKAFNASDWKSNRHLRYKVINLNICSSYHLKAYCVMKTASYHGIGGLFFTLLYNRQRLHCHLSLTRLLSTFLILILFAVVATIIQSCNSTRIVNSWRDPETMVSFGKLNKVLITAFLKDEASRRVAEDRMTELLKGRAVPSYSYLGNQMRSVDDAAGRERLKKDAFDGAVVMRLVDVSKEVNYTPGNINTYPVYFRTFGGYIRRGWSYYSTPERHYTTHSYSVEITIYSIKQDKLIWSALTETIDPSGVDKLVAEISSRIYKKMMQEGFITD